MFFALVVFAFLCLGVTATPYTPHIQRSESGTRAQVVQGNYGIHYRADLIRFPGRPTGSVIAYAPVNGIGVNFNVLFAGLKPGQQISTSTFSPKLGAGTEI